MVSPGVIRRLTESSWMRSRLRNRRRGPVAGVSGPTGVLVEADEQLIRTGNAIQGGQPMTLKGTGTRRINYEFVADGWLNNLSARDSLDVVVGVTDQTIPVRWRSTLIARLRDIPPR